MDIDKREEIVEDKLTWRFWEKKRYIVVLMAFFGFFNVYALRVNLSVAIVAMVEKRNETQADGSVIQVQDFDWSSKQQGLILSSFFYGYITTQLAGGYFSNKLGGHRLFGWGIGVTAILTLLTPLACKSSVNLLIALRIIEGVFEGVTFPCVHAIWSRWAPVYERSRMAMLAYSGNYAGTVVSMTVSGLLAKYWGWESVFYFFGTVGCIWLILWLIIVKESPAHDKHMTQKERDYILSSIGDSSSMKTIKHPWKAIFTSAPVWAIAASQFSELWGFYTLLTQLPTFLKDSLDFELAKTGIISSLPYLTMGLMLGVAGYLADWVQVKKYLTTTQVRRYFNCGGFAFQTVCMLLVGFVMDPTLCVLFITIGVGFGAFAWTGFAVNHLDIAPRHASVLMGISNTAGTIPGIVSPLLTGLIVDQNQGSRGGWQIVFYIGAGVYLLGCTIYWFFASGDLQPWAKEAEELVDKESRAKSDKEQGHTNGSLEVNE